MSVADRERFVDLQQIGVFRFNRETNQVRRSLACVVARFLLDNGIEPHHLQIEVESNTLCNNIDEVVLIGKKLSPPGENVVSAKFKENEFIFHVEVSEAWDVAAGPMAHAATAAWCCCYVVLSRPTAP